MLFPPECVEIIRIHEQLEHLANIHEGTVFQQRNVRVSPISLSALIETAFWTGLESNEGRMTRVRLFVGSPERVPGARRFASPIPYESSEITKLAPALPPDHSFGLEETSGTFQLWGFAHRQAVRSLETIAIETAEPGTLRVDVGPFRPFAVLDGRSNEILAGTGIGLADYLRRRLEKNFPPNDMLETQAVWRECIALSDLARMILETNHGGAVLVVPSDSEEWVQSLSSFPYRYQSPDTTVRDVIRTELSSADARARLYVDLLQAPISDELRNRVSADFPRATWAGASTALRAIVPLSGVDGAVVLTRDLALIGFGAKIRVAQGSDVRIAKFLAKPGDQSIALCELEGLGGMRHQSAAQFIAQNKKAAALVVSQDRHVSVMTWDETLSAVCVVRNAEWWV
jgi:hypothetical protein